MFDWINKEGMHSTYKDLSKFVRGLDEDRIWDEYLSLTGIYSYEPDKKIPHPHFVEVSVVHGSNEGLYLHVRFVSPEKNDIVVLGKTLACSTDKWYECYLSAARIAMELGA